MIRTFVIVALLFIPLQSVGAETTCAPTDESVCIHAERENTGDCTATSQRNLGVDAGASTPEVSASVSAAGICGSYTDGEKTWEFGNVALIVALATPAGAPAVWLLWYEYADSEGETHHCTLNASGIGSTCPLGLGPRTLLTRLP